MPDRERKGVSKHRSNVLKDLSPRVLLPIPTKEEGNKEDYRMRWQAYSLGKMTELSEVESEEYAHARADWLTAVCE